MRFRALAVTLLVLTFVSFTQASELTDALSKLPASMICDGTRVIGPYPKAVGKVELNIDLSDLNQPVVETIHNGNSTKIGNGHVGSLLMNSSRCGYHTEQLNSEMALYYVCDSDHPDQLTYKDVTESQLRASFIFSSNLQGRISHCRNQMSCLDLKNCVPR